VFVETLFIFSYRSIILLADIIDENHSVVSAASDEVGVLHAKFAGSDSGLVVKYFLREGWVFEGPEHQQSTLSSPIHVCN
jgi:putative flippase GtrA